MDKVCRICMSGAGDLLDIFVPNAESPSLQEMINECVDVKIKRDDHYSKKICGICIGGAIAAYRFKKNYQLTLEQLSKTIPMNKSKEEGKKTTKITKSIKKQKLFIVPKKFSKEKVKRIKINLHQLNLKKKSELTEKKVTYICEICGMRFSKKVGLKLHMNWHKQHKHRTNFFDAASGTFKCAHCHSDFKYKHSLTRHLTKQICGTKA